MATLIITNGDIATDLLRASNVQGEIVPWRDLLYWGACTNNENEETFFNLRSQTISQLFNVSEQEIENTITTRNSFIKNHGKYDRIELWFEHDLNDQLQLLQVLHMLAKQLRITNIFLIQALSYLNLHSPETILNLNNLTIPVDNKMIERAVSLWSAFTEQTPEKLYSESKPSTPGFPVMKQAIARALRELPGYDGLSQTERQILYSIGRGVQRPGMLLARVNNMEEAAFQIDTTFFILLSNMVFCQNPLIEGLPEIFSTEVLNDNERRKSFITSEVTLTKLGQRILDGTEDNIQHNTLERWIGGTHLTNNTAWRWDSEKELLIQPH